jgi:hypothetical protein
LFYTCLNEKGTAAYSDAVPGELRGTYDKINKKAVG